jgi:hypothetical protein
MAQRRLVGRVAEERERHIADDQVEIELAARFTPPERGSRDHARMWRQLRELAGRRRVSQALTHPLPIANDRVVGERDPEAGRGNGHH